VSGKVTGG